VFVASAGEEGAMGKSEYEYEDNEPLLEKLQPIVQSIAVLALICVTVWFVVYLGVYAKRDVEKLEEKELELLEAEFHHENPGINLDTEDYIIWEKLNGFIDGHDYLKFSSYNGVAFSVVHSPECNLCRKTKSEK
jgi:hypothetical protein